MGACGSPQAYHQPNGQPAPVSQTSPNSSSCARIRPPQAPKRATFHIPSSPVPRAIFGLSPSIAIACDLAQGPPKSCAVARRATLECGDPFPLSLSKAVQPAATGNALRKPKRRPVAALQRLTLAKSSLRSKRIPAIFPPRTDLQPPPSPQPSAASKLPPSAPAASFPSVANRNGHIWSIPRTAYPLSFA